VGAGEGPTPSGTATEAEGVSGGPEALSGASVCLRGSARISRTAHWRVYALAGHRHRAHVRRHLQYLRRLLQLLVRAGRRAEVWLAYRRLYLAPVSRLSTT